MTTTTITPRPTPPGGAFVLPSVAAIALLALALVEDSGTLMLIQHAIMPPAMLVAMLLRRDEYAGHHHHAAVA